MEKEMIHGIYVPNKKASDSIYYILEFDFEYKYEVIETYPAFNGREYSDEMKECIKKYNLQELRLHTCSPSAAIKAMRTEDILRTYHNTSKEKELLKLFE